MAGTSHLHNVLLRLLGASFKEISSRFDFIAFTHVFKELNTLADTLSKESQYLNEG
jgi:hypothetical protein